jgi:uncharacterized protein (TIGR00725 family)
MEKTKQKITRIAFFGDAEATKDNRFFKSATKAAKILAENGYIIVNGGGPGIMLASSLGAKLGNGKVEIIIISSSATPNNFEGVNDKNIKIADKVIKTANYQSRLNMLINHVDAFVIFPGGTGTLAEVGMAWSQAKFDFGHHKPLIFFGKSWQKIISEMIAQFHFEPKERGVYQIVNSPTEIISALQKLVEN